MTKVEEYSGLSGKSTQSKELRQLSEWLNKTKAEPQETFSSVKAWVEIISYFNNVNIKK